MLWDWDFGLSSFLGSSVFIDLRFPGLRPEINDTHSDESGELWGEKKMSDFHCSRGLCYVAEVSFL